MRVRLLQSGTATGSAAPDPSRAVEDLGLAELWVAMADGDPRLEAIARNVLCAPLTDPADITFRLDVLDDCRRNAAAVRSLYDLANHVIDLEATFLRGGSTRAPEALLRRSGRVLDACSSGLHELRGLAEREHSMFSSDGFTRLFEMLRHDLDEPFLADMKVVIDSLDIDGGLLISGGLGIGNKPDGLVLRGPVDQGNGRQRGRGRGGPGAGARMRRRRSSASDGLVVPSPAGVDESIRHRRDLRALRDGALTDVAGAASRAADHVRDFFVVLRDELGFYLGCLNLEAWLHRIDVPTCRPQPVTRAAGMARHDLGQAKGLSEPCLALNTGRPVVRNDLDGHGRRIVVVTGPNSGGKSTFLRSIGLAQWMMQCGMSVAADSFAAPVATCVVTHFPAAEESGTGGGRLDDELSRLRTVVESLRVGGLLLCNESLSSTNEREGAQIAADVAAALAESGVRTVFVTHFPSLAGQVAQALGATTADAVEGPNSVVSGTDTGVAHGGWLLSLRAERATDGSRTFVVLPGAPERTAHGMDVYHQVFG